MAVNSRKHTVPGATDTPSRALFAAGFASVNDIVPVATVTERGTVATAIGPTATRPLFVYRADAAVGLEIEVTEDGTNWRTIPSYKGKTAWTFERTSANATDNFTANAMTSLISGALPSAPPGDYMVHVVLALSAAAATSGNLRMIVNSVNTSSDMRADLGTDVRPVNFVTTVTHNGGQLNFDAQFQAATQIGSVWRNGSRVSLGYMGPNV